MLFGDSAVSFGYEVLVFSRTEGFRHADQITAGQTAIQQLGAANGFTTTLTEDPAAFTASNLATYEAVVFLNTTGDVLDAPEQTAMENYIEAGGGYVGIHSASDTEYGWSWYGSLVGGVLRRSPARHVGGVDRRG